jgi:hypothetical protein
LHPNVQARLRPGLELANRHTKGERLVAMDQAALPSGHLGHGDIDRIHAEK